MKFIKKHLKYFIAFSLLLNAVAALFVAKRLYYQFYYNDKYFAEQNNKPSVPYFLNRQQVFRLLPNDSDEIIFAGNSHAHNFEVAELFKLPNIKNRGINGDNSLGLLERLDEITESKPKKIFIEIGIND